MKRHKYGAKKVIVTEDGTMFEVEQLKKYNITDVKGIKFDSKMEASYYLTLLNRYAAGEIKAIELQPTFVLQDKPKIRYIADFRVTWASGAQNIIDVKGMKTAAFKIKLRLFKAKYPELALFLVTQKGRQWQEVPV